ncbi:hypothetical protein [Paraferrimonas haliotis]|uniref:Uncharacterized protein n=1 Tax=Paraferrimonas haliotis TaxID=2013866 RepID=A0AA37WXG0_9GAMM|nr:hypothetical protein [Paraferrimonas haliotis]GLS83479.1 hypothetical protein GCM10007894_14560 [Paraferrimonas haliotis]
MKSLTVESLVTTVVIAALFSLWSALVMPSLSFGQAEARVKPAATNYASELSHPELFELANELSSQPAIAIHEHGLAMHYVVSDPFLVTQFGLTQELTNNGWYILQSETNGFGNYSEGTIQARKGNHYATLYMDQDNANTLVALCLWPTQPQDQSCQTR